MRLLRGKVDTGDPLVTGMATYGNGNLSVLLSYFLPPDWLVAFNLFEPGTDLASILEEGARAPKGVFENTLKRSAQGQPGTIPATFSSATKTYLQNVAQFARAAQARRGVPADIRLAVQGMADAAWTSQDFLVDGPGSDSFSQRKDIQAKLSAYMRPGANLRSAQPIIGQINSATGLRPGETRQVQAQTSRLTLTTRLNPYEVRLIVLNQGNQAPAVASQQ